MNWFKEKKQLITDYLIDHPLFRRNYRWTYMFILEAISAFIFAFSFRAFVKPTSTSVEVWLLENGASEAIIKKETLDPTSLISGGAGGLSQVILSFILIFSHIDSATQSLLISIFYFAINTPLFIFAFRKISKQFAIFTFINVGFVSLFQSIIPDEWVYSVVNIYNDLLARSIFGGLCSGLSSGLAMLIGTSGGGSDIVTTFFSERKTTSVGKYSLTFNSLIVATYVVVNIISHTANPSWNTQDNSKIISSALYTIIYFFVSSRMLDLLNTKHKKLEIQIFTTETSLPKILIHAFPHSCTVVESKGAFSGGKNYIIYMVISKFELKKSVKLIKEYAPEAFVSVTEIKTTIGKFYTKGIDDSK